MHSRLNLRLLLAALFMCTALSGCVLVPFLDSFKQAGFTESDRRQLLPQQLKQFSQALYWGQGSEALSMVTDEIREAFRQELRRSRNEERVVESSVEDVEFSEGARTADVEFKVRYYKIPYYVVRDRVEKQIWKFTVSDGWRLVSRSIVEAG